MLELITRLALASPSAEYRPLYRWSITDGLQRLDLVLEPQRHKGEPRDVLAHIRALTRPAVFVLLDFHPVLDDPVHTRLLKDIAIGAKNTGIVVVLVSHRIALPSELRSRSARFELRMPDAAERRRLLLEAVEEYQDAEPGRRVPVDPTALDLLVANLGGLDYADTRRLARAAVIDDGALTHSDIPEVMQAKHRLLNQSGILVFEYDTARFDAIAGFGNVKQWLARRRSAFAAEQPPGLDPPRGILLLGVQGCGKSMAAKAAAGALAVPLLRLDFGSIYAKYHGESERNLREALNTAEILSPCVLWIDEIEKGLAADDGDSGTSRRVLGSLLTWMAEHRTRVFLVATANDVQALPPELIRKGRFDETFFVDLPEPLQRHRIFEIHLQRRGQAPAAFDLERLSQASEGFSGAEIEQAIVSALYAAHAANEPLADRHLAAELEQTRPLSVLMAEKVQALRRWAGPRTVAAD
jgi:SpoVK/Ycf46/Vps4 family AAA+-type ATPase